MSDKLKEDIRSKVNIRIPGLKKGVGAGDMVAKATKAVGIEPCDECEKRRQWMNRMLRLSGKKDD